MDNRKYVHSFLQVLADHSATSEKYLFYEEDEYEKRRKRRLRESERKMYFYAKEDKKPRKEKTNKRKKRKERNEDGKEKKMSVGEILQSMNSDTTNTGPMASTSTAESSDIPPSEAYAAPADNSCGSSSGAATLSSTSVEQGPFSTLPNSWVPLPSFHAPNPYNGQGQQMQIPQPHPNFTSTSHITMVPHSPATFPMAQTHYPPQQTAMQMSPSSSLLQSDPSPQLIYPHRVLQHHLLPIATQQVSYSSSIYSSENVPDEGLDQSHIEMAYYNSPTVAGNHCMRNAAGIGGMDSGQAHIFSYHHHPSSGDLREGHTSSFVEEQLLESHLVGFCGTDSEDWYSNFFNEASTCCNSSIDPSPQNLSPPSPSTLPTFSPSAPTAEEDIVQSEMLSSNKTFTEMLTLDEQSLSGYF